MRVQAQVLAPGVQHTNGAALHPVMAVAKSLQYAPCTLKHSVVKALAVGHTYRVQRFRNGKHHVEVFHIQGIVHTVFCPKRLFVRLALRAMAVTATVVTDAFPTATIAGIFVAAQGRCPAFLQRIEGPHSKTIGPVLLNKLRPKPFNDLGNFKLGAHYFFGGYRVSSGLWADPGEIWAICK